MPRPSFRKTNLVEARKKLKTAKTARTKATAEGNAAAELKCAGQKRRHEETKHTLVPSPLAKRSSCPCETCKSESSLSKRRILKSDFGSKRPLGYSAAIKAELESHGIELSTTLVENKKLLKQLSDKNAVYITYSDSPAATPGPDVDPLLPADADAPAPAANTNAPDAAAPDAAAPDQTGRTPPKNAANPLTCPLSCLPH